MSRPRHQPSDHFTRRDLLASVPAAAAWLLAHESFAQAHSPRAATPVPKYAADRPSDKAQPSHRPRIRALRLLTAVPLAKMRDFYRDTIGFRLLEERETEVTLAAGATHLTFVKARPDQIAGDGGRGHGEPMYHFAFNIPRNRIRAARAWQLERTSLVPPRPGLCEDGWPKDIWHFRHWNARSIFYFDPAYNIVEYIARHELPDAPGPDIATAAGAIAGPRAIPGSRAVPFSAADILYVSEIGFVVDQPRQAHATRLLSDKLGLHEYPRGADPWAMGDAHGLLLCLARLGQKWGEESPTPVTWGVFPTECTVAGTIKGAPSDVVSRQGHGADTDPPRSPVTFDGFPYTIRVE